LGIYTIAKLINEAGPTQPVALRWAEYYDAADHGGNFPWKVEKSLGGRKLNGIDVAEVNYQLAAASNELASTRILLCPSEVRRLPATNFATLALSNISYCLGIEADEGRPGNILAADRGTSGFDFTGPLR
jgi:hypothetical protein